MVRTAKAVFTEKSPWGNELMSNEKQDWRIFRGDGKQLGRIKSLPPAPPWRQFRHTIDPPKWDERTINYWKQLQNIVRDRKSSRDEMRGRNFCLPEHSQERNKIIDAVNAALYLRRPLLVTGKPGTGKTSLAYSVAYELQLGPVLKWPITTRSTLEEGLYQYDALGRLQAIQQENAIQQERVNTPSLEPSETSNDIGEFIRLGPLGTAFLPVPYPRVLLIDEIDKIDITFINFIYE